MRASHRRRARACVRSTFDRRVDMSARTAHADVAEQGCAALGALALFSAMAFLGYRKNDALGRTCERVAMWLVVCVGCGTIAAFDLVTDGEQGYLNPAGKVLRGLVRDQGVLIRPLGDVVYLLPPLCISDDQLDQCYDALHSGLDALPGR